MNKKVVGILLILLTSSIIGGTYTVFAREADSGELLEVNLDIYSDYDCAVSISNVDWGEIEIGGKKNIVIYIKNNGVVDTVASLAFENWNPLNADDYMTLSWDYDGQIISPGKVVEVELSLVISSECPLINDFGFDIIVIGS